MRTREQPLFSIITVTLNPGATLGRTVDSVKSQRCREFEHIIKDGGSIDGSLQRFAAAADDYRPNVIRQQDSGIYDAMNQGLSLARGKYVLFLNSGDRLYDENVLEIVAAQVSRDPAPVLVYGDYYDEPLRMVMRSPKRLGGFFLYRNTLCHQACFVERSAIEGLGGFDTSLRVLADYDLLLRIVRGLRAPCQYVRSPLASTLGGGFSAQRSNAEFALGEAVLLRRRYFTPAV
jgi:glycosyltransferase involved in cell wall biosynthesis